MKRIEEVLPEGAATAYDVHRGQEVVHVGEDGEVRTWTCPYCGPRTFHAPKFRANAAQLAELEQRVLKMASAGLLRKVRCTKDAEDGTAEWCLMAFVENSSPMLAGD